MIDSTTKRTYFGIDVVIEVLASSDLKFFRASGKILLIRPFYLLASNVYNAVSTSRYFISKIFLKFKKIAEKVPAKL